MGQKIILTITMLVSDREDTIEKCMLSLKNLLEKVPSELIVVNTANNKKCMEVVRQYTDKIVPFEWCDDFSAARNVGLERAKGEWLMFLDDDEWFESTKEIEKFFLEGIYQQYGSAAYLTRNYKDMEGTRWSDRIAVRLIKLNKDVKFQGLIHEYLGPMQYPTYYTKDYVHHYGYVFKNKEEELAHSWRNIRPLIKQRKEKQDDFQVAGQLIQEYLCVGENYTAIEIAKEMRNHPMANNSDKIGFTSYAMVMEIKLYQTLHRYQEAYDVTKELLSDKNILLITRGCLTGLMISTCFCLKKYEEVLCYIEEFKKHFSIWKQNPNLERTDFFSMAEQLFNEDELKRYELVKLNIYVLQENWEHAKEILYEIDWKFPWKRLQIETPQNIIQILIHCREIECSNPHCVQAIEKMLEQQVLRKEFYKNIEELEKEEKEIVLSFVTQIEPKDYQLMKYHLQYNFFVKNKEKIEKLLVLMQEKNYSVLLPKEEYWFGLKELGINLTPYLNQIPIEEYFRLGRALYEKMSLDGCEAMNHILWKDIKKEDIRYRYLKGFYLQKILLEKKEEKNSLSELWDVLLALSELWISCAKDLFKPEIFENEYFSAMPDIYRFSWWLVQGESEKNNIKLHIKNVAEAAKCYLPLSELIKKYLQGIQEEKPTLQNTEFNDLAYEVKKKIRLFIESGDLVKAETVLNQLVKLLPEDKELSDMQNLIQKEKLMSSKL